MSSIFRRTSSEPNINVTPPPIIAESDGVSIDSFARFLEKEGLENHPMLMVSEIIIERKITLKAFPCSLKWKAASKIPNLRDSFKGGLHTATMIFNESGGLLWRKRRMNDGSQWFLSSQSLVLDGQRPRQVAGHALVRQTGVVTHIEPVMLFVSPETLDIVIVYGAQIKSDTKLMPGKESEDLFWSPIAEPPAKTVGIAKEISAAFEQLYPEIPDRIAV